MKLYTGTSGWSYPWNPDGLEWYMSTGLNAVELNSSFYHFPYKNSIASWKRKTEGKDFRWSVKVNKNITHTHKLNEGSYGLWRRFLDLFRPLDDNVDFYLFQLPPSFKGSDENMDRIERFVDQSGIEDRARIAVEPRDAGWLDYAGAFRTLGVTLVSVDCPDFQWILNTSDASYLRFHGHKEWYAYTYSDKELAEFADKQRALGCDRNYAFFNNDTGMLENTRSYSSAWKLKVGIDQ